MKKERKVGNNLRTVMITTIALLFLTVIVVFITLKFFDKFRVDKEDISVYDKYYVLITDDYRLSFWQAVYDGALKEATQNDAFVELMGSDLSKNYSKKELVDIAIASKVDGIIIQADESNDVLEAINKATENGIPVVTAYGDCSQSKRISYVGVGSYNLGKEYGKQVLNLKTQMNLNANRPLKVSILINSNEKDSGQNILYSGIQESLASAGDTVELNMLQVDGTSTFTVEESIRDILMSSNLPDVVICLSEQNTICTYQAVVDFNLVGKMGILGYYDSDTILQGINRNVIYSTVSIDTDELGKFCVEALNEYKAHNNASQYYTADIDIVNKNNVLSYMEEDHDEKN